MEPEPKFDITSVTERGPENSHADLDELAQRIKEEHSKKGSESTQPSDGDTDVEP